MAEGCNRHNTLRTDEYPRTPQRKQTGGQRQARGWGCGEWGGRGYGIHLEGSLRARLLLKTPGDLKKKSLRPPEEGESPHPPARHGTPPTPPDGDAGSDSAKPHPRNPPPQGDPSPGLQSGPARSSMQQKCRPGGNCDRISDITVACRGSSGVSGGGTPPQCHYAEVSHLSDGGIYRPLV